jgi:drug/metabolite transporter (DMT)-like permease
VHCALGGPACHLQPTLGGFLSARRPRRVVSDRARLVPLLVALGAAVVANERLDYLSLAGIVLISLGILGLAFENRTALAARALVPALLTGMTIAAYTLADGLGARLSGNSQAYAAWLFVSYGPAMLLILAFRRGSSENFRLDADAARSALGGIVSMAAYAIVIWAASVSPVGPVSALRGTGVVFAALLGRLFLRERLSPRRMAACTIVAFGGGLPRLRASMRIIKGT